MNDFFCANLIFYHNFYTIKNHNFNTKIFVHISSIHVYRTDKHLIAVQYCGINKTLYLYENDPIDKVRGTK